MSNNPEMYGTLRDPATKATEITAGSEKLSQVPRAIYIGTDGDLTVEMFGNEGTSVTFNNVKAGVIYPIRPIKITACPADTLALN